VQPETHSLTWLLEKQADARPSTDFDSGTIEPARTEQSQKDLPLSGSDFVDWRDRLQPSCLLITAPPGSGKSVLSNFVINHLLTCEKLNAKVIYYFCNIRVATAERTAEAVVRALIVQLCQHQPRIMDLLPNRFEQNSDDFHKASLSELWSVMKDMVDKSPVPRIYCVIDGLDVYETGMIDLVQKLGSFFSVTTSKGQPGIKLLCTSRPDREILLAWAGQPERQLRTHAQDLRIFVQSRIEELEDFRPEMRAAARSALEKDIGDDSQHGGARPTFLWASVVVRRLRNLVVPTIAKVKREIEDSSQDLDQLFEGLILKIHTRAKEYTVVLAWVVYAQQSLRLRELEHAVAIGPACGYTSYEQLDENRPDFTPTSFRQDLGVLLDIIDDKVFVIHQSLQDFLTRTDLLERLITSAPRLYVVDSCIRYLLLCYAKDQEPGECKEASLPLLLLIRVLFLF
jgi:hypothetical protein